jgi:hypothetical protein
VKITGGDGVLLVGGEAFTWRPWLVGEDGKNGMVNAKGQFEVDEQAWGVLDLVWPRPGMFAQPIFIKAGILTVLCDRSVDSWNGCIDSPSLAGDENAYQLAGDSG